MTEETMNAIAAYICNQVVNQPLRSLAPDEPLISSGVVDSFHLVDLALFVEDTFGVRIEDYELNANTFDTLAQLAMLIESRKS